jgi:hypothetical protein
VVNYDERRKMNLDHIYDVIEKNTRQYEIYSELELEKPKELVHKEWETILDKLLKEWAYNTMLMDPLELGVTFYDKVKFCGINNLKCEQDHPLLFLQEISNTDRQNMFLPFLQEYCKNKTTVKNKLSYKNFKLDTCCFLSSIEFYFVITPL